MKSSSDDQTPMSAILQTEIEHGLNELQRPSGGLFLSALSAGLDIGFGPLLMATVATTAAGTWSDVTSSIVLANLYAIGFIFVVLGRSELFTEHTTLAVVPVLNGDASVKQLGRLWGIIYAGNIVGAVAFSLIAVTVAPSFGIVDPSAFVDIALKLVDHPPEAKFAAAILAGWLMGLLSWLVSAAQETISRTFFVWLVATTIGIAHLPHCIAGIVEVLPAMIFSPKIGLATFAEFMAVSTVGNAIGGSVFVALLKYGHVVRAGSTTSR
ncbi:formate/nitrite transporter family protein [Halogeometricum sp. S1BR25-6]|uniref:Formate/nitrite transporter family protein n=2 Tax=Halogeometricum salsisoli TaxID=2950536 RepID=A0ABU2GAT3_9EURY|nr:formate/nitrite transporter family protein [Halogeometricum sp. S1BR25-6]MDS0297409.1 formate/nitrite transporter family protein [Halogeometricum sp. S1BR25-6]